MGKVNVLCCNVVQCNAGIYTIVYPTLLMHFFDLWRIEDPFHLKETSTAKSTTAMLNCLYWEPVHCTLAVKSLAHSIPPFAIP